jgi:FO synthase
MLESASERLMDTVHAGSPTKHPEKRLETIRLAGELKIPFTSGILVGIGETEEERVASLEALAAVHAEHGHLQEVILQNFVPHQRYYGREVADIADEAAQSRWAGTDEADSGTRALDSNGGTPASLDSPHVPSSASSVPDLPDWATPITLDDMRLLVRECKRLMPDVGVQIPPNLSDWWADLVEEGATDLGGLSSNGDHISPEEARCASDWHRRGMP